VLKRSNGCLLAVSSLFVFGCAGVISSPAAEIPIHDATAAPHKLTIHPVRLQTPPSLSTPVVMAGQTTEDHDGSQSLVVGIDASNKHTASDIVSEWKRDRPTYNGEPYLKRPSTRSPYSAGSLQPGYLQDGLKMANFVRYLAGLPNDLVLDTDLDDQAQYGVVVDAALNELTHFPERPKDMDEDFYQIGYQSTTSSNLYEVIGGTETLAQQVLGYMDDSDPSNIAHVGHRRWILNPPLRKTGFGQAENDAGNMFGAMQVFDTSDTRSMAYRAITWPTTGYFPLEIDGQSLFNASEAWSVSLNPDEYRLPLQGVWVTLTRESDHRVWTFSSKTPQYGYFNVDDEWIGIPDCIIFRPTNIEYHPGDVFDVHIDGLTTATGQASSLDYQVRFINLLPSTPVVDPVTDRDHAVTGTAQPGAKVTVKVDDKVLGTALAGNDGTYSVKIPKQKAGTKLFVTAADAAGDVSPARIVRVLEVTPPAKPVVNPVSDYSTTVTGRAEPGSTVTVTVGSKVIGKGTAGTDGTYSVSIPRQKGGTKLTVTARDAFGNVSAASVVTVKDTTPPNIYSVTYSSNRPTLITGRAEAGATIVVKNGSRVIGKAKAGRTGAFSVIIPKQRPGTKLSITAIDSAGNTSWPVDIDI
jgi:hypothetical protein